MNSFTDEDQACICLRNEKENYFQRVKVDLLELSLSTKMI